MKIRKVTINGFRCLLNFEVEFENDITVIVGENDAGKTSLIDCLKVITQGKSIESDDFNHNLNVIDITIQTEDFKFQKSYERKDGGITEKDMCCYPTEQYKESVLAWLDNDDIDLTDGDTIQKIKDIAKTFGIVVKSTSNIGNLKANVLQKIKSENTEISGAKFPDFNNIQLDGRHFENISSFFKEVFLKQKQSEIWDEKVGSNVTIEEFVKNKIDSYSELIEQDIIDKGVLGRMKIFLKDLTEVKIEPIYQKKDLNIDAKVKFIENGQEVSIDKKGDGTKRRITMALLEYKKEQSLIPSDNSTIYLLDEPDTHLHVKAQIEFLDAIKSFAQTGSQVIVTTHSPFIINSIHPKQLRLLENTNNHSKIKFLKQDKAQGTSDSSKVLRALGIENTYLFFSRHIIIVEGETEEKFLPAYYLKRFDETLSSSLIKVINCKGIPNIPGFATAILQLHQPENIHILYDNDATPELTELIDKLGIPESRKYIIGTNEFEDAFSDEALFSAWEKYLAASNKPIPSTWSVSEIGIIRQDCLNNGLKFSKQIRGLNHGSNTKMSKPILGDALGSYLEEEMIPEQLHKMFNSIR